ncbi:hypothetical protein [Streptomyces sp. NPDC053048]|uniref:hypothetical protein n=1 Tax=Streptomyces sp. NPDC053048 TaxID=3365694 RepID=UPI0037D285F0
MAKAVGRGRARRKRKPAARKASEGTTVRRRRGLDTSVPYCSKCGSTLVQTWLPGPSMHVLVDTARPEAGVLAVSIHSDDFPQGVFKDPWPVMCAVCEQDCGSRPRQWGHRLYEAMMAVLEEGEWPRARDWEVEDQFTDWYETRLRKAVDSHEELLTGERPFRYGSSKDYDPPGRGAPEEGEDGPRVDQGPSGAAAEAGGPRMDQDPSEAVPPAGGLGVDHPPTVEEAVAGVLAARAAEARWLELLGVALRAEYAPGKGRELARRAAPAMSRTLVLRELPPGSDNTPKE